MATPRIRQYNLHRSKLFVNNKKEIETIYTFFIFRFKNGSRPEGTVKRTSFLYDRFPDRWDSGLDAPRVM